MFLMALDHACWYLLPTDRPENLWGALPRYTSLLSFLTGFLPHFAAPGFSFLMGVSMVLLANSRRKKGWEDRQVLQFFITRGLFFIAIQFGVENFLWQLRLRPDVSQYTYFGVLFSLGTNMILGAFFINFARHYLITIGAIGLTVTWWAIPSNIPIAASISLLQRILYLPGETPPVSVYFSVFPWAFLTLLGIACGKSIQMDSKKALRRMPYLGVALLTCFAIVRVSSSLGNLGPLPENPSWIDYLVLTKYPPSFLFLCITLGFELTLLGLWARFPLGKYTFHFFEKLGSAPFFFYLAHLILFSFFGFLIGINGLSLTAVWGVWIIGVLLLLPLVNWFSRFKQRQSVNSLWRML